MDLKGRVWWVWSIHCPQEMLLSSLSAWWVSSFFPFSWFFVSRFANSSWLTWRSAKDGAIEGGISRYWCYYTSFLQRLRGAYFCTQPSSLPCIHLVFNQVFFLFFPFFFLSRMFVAGDEEWLWCFSISFSKFSYLKVFFLPLSKGTLMLIAIVWENFN